MSVSENLIKKKVDEVLVISDLKHCYDENEGCAEVEWRC